MKHDIRPRTVIVGNDRVDTVLEPQHREGCKSSDRNPVDFFCEGCCYKHYVNRLRMLPGRTERPATTTEGDKSHELN